jgi:hypothetical protein
MTPLSRCVLVVLLCASFGAPALAATVLVQNDGLDSDTCGGKGDPCRSISHGISRANAGDQVLVGPGRYGELTNNGNFTDPGEELNGPGGMIVIDKAIKVQSVAGATMTVIDGRGLVTTGVSITADGASFGGAKRGFTVTGAMTTAVESSGTGDTISGNLALGNGGGTGFSISGTQATVFGNVALANEIGFTIAAANGTVRGNISWLNQLVGYSISGDSTILDRNLAAANGTAGFNASVATIGAGVTGNVAIANGENGIALTGPGFSVKNNSAIGNDGNGLGFADVASSPSGGNLFGNLGCGLRNASNGASSAPHIYFGSPDGPSETEPADRVCNIGSSTTTTDPFATRPSKLGLKPLF